MALKHVGYIDLPPHRKSGGFDHAAVNRGKARLYVAHTANDALDVIDCSTDHYLHSIPNLTGVAGALVSEERNLVFTSNRGENTVGIFSSEAEGNLSKVAVGIRPNGLTYAPAQNLLLVANVGDPNIPNSFTASIVDVAHGKMLADIPVPGRTRWAIFDSAREMFYLNIADPAEIILVDLDNPNLIARTFAIPANGPHGLDLDVTTRRLFCACDGKKLVTLNADSGNVLQQSDLSGIPDVIFFTAKVEHLYVAIGDPGVIDVFDTKTMTRIETVPTERGAHTIGLDSDRNKVYAFLPETHRAALYVDTGA